MTLFSTVGEDYDPKFSENPLCCFFFFYIHVTVPNCTFVYFPPDLSQNLQELKEIGRSGRKGRAIFLGWVRLFCRFFGGWGGSICRGKE